MEPIIQPPIQGTAQGTVIITDPQKTPPTQSEATNVALSTKSDTEPLLTCKIGLCNLNVPADRYERHVFICHPKKEQKPKHAGGRPCEFCKKKDEILAKTKRYLDLCRVKSADGSRTRHVNIPYVEELALELDVDDETVVLWTKKKKIDNENELEHPEFSATIKRLRTMQKMMLLKHSLGKNPAGSIFQLKANYGLMEAEKKILAGDTNEPLQIEFVSERKLNE